jgi:O-antigen ligase
MRRYGLPILVILLLCGQTLRMPVALISFKSTAILPNDVGLGCFVLVYVIHKLYSRRLFIQHAALAKPIFVFIAVATLSLGVNIHYYALSRHEIIVSSLYFLRWILYCAVYFIVFDLIRSRKDLTEFLGVVGAGVLLFAVFGIYQAIFLPNFAFMVHPEAAAGSDWDIQYNRLVSTFLDPNLAGCLLAMGLVFAVALMMEGYRKAWLAIVILGTAIILTYSRGACLSFLSAYFYLVATGKNKRRAFIAAGAIAVLALAVAPYVIPYAERYNKFTISDASARARLDNWQLGVGLVEDNFFFGIGFDTLAFIVPRYGYLTSGASAFGLDGGLLLIFALTGVFGFTTYCCLLGKVMQMAHFVGRHSKDKLFVALTKGAAASAIVIVVSSLFTSSLTYVFTMEFSWMVFATSSVVYLEVKQKRIGSNGQRQTSKHRRNLTEWKRAAVTASGRGSQ